MKIALFRFVKLMRCGCLTLLLSQAAVSLLFGQQRVAQIDLSPLDAADTDVVTFKLSGIWPDGCVPQSPVVSVSPGAIGIDTTNPAITCTQALTPWTLTGRIGKLPAGRYDVVVRYSGSGVTNPVEIGRRTFTVLDSSLITDLILPMVLNGAVAEKLHYQTIFTVLNASASEVKGNLQLYANPGTAPGAFCSPLAPAPSNASFTLGANAQYFQFTSPDLAFLNGWARLRWQGPVSILVSEELTLVAAAPAPCLLVCNRPSTEKLSSAQITAVKPAHEFKMPMTINPNRQTAVALINPSSSDPVTVKVQILDSAGQSPQLAVPNQFEITVGPLQRVSKYVWQMAFEQSSLASLPDPPDSFQGSLVFSSASPFVASGLHIMFPEGKFATVPVISTQ
jgi:hypothetical protein